MHLDKLYSSTIKLVMITIWFTDVHSTKSHSPDNYTMKLIAGKPQD